MKLAFCLFNYFPFGGLQRDFLRIAEQCVQRGHTVEVFTMCWEGEHDPRIHVTIVPVSGWQNHTQAKQFVKQLQPHLKNYDGVIGFNKMPGLDIYYAADTCYQAKARDKHYFLYRLTPRYRHYADYEKAVFDRSAKTKILLIAPQQKEVFMHYYGTKDNRFYLLPPGIAKDRIAPPNAADIRNHLRKKLNLKQNDFLLLMVGSGFKTKGLDRTLLSIAALPKELKEHTRLYVIGNDDATSFIKQAKRLKIMDRVHFLGGRNDVPQFLLAADLLLHPAYNENTGTVLLEAVASGLPVLTTDVCGYAHYIEEAEAGIVLASPFNQETMNKTLQNMLLSPLRATWHHHGIAFASSADIYSMPERAAQIIEKVLST